MSNLLNHIRQSGCMHFVVHRSELQSYMWIMLLFCGTMTLSGCVEFRHKYSIVKLFVDYNSQEAPAITCERLNHEPAEPVRVDSFRWMYNRPVGKRVDEWQHTQVTGIAQISTQQPMQPMMQPMRNPPEAPLPDAIKFDTAPVSPTPAPKLFPKNQPYDVNEPIAKPPAPIQQISGSVTKQPVQPRKVSYSWLFTTPSQQ